MSPAESEAMGIWTADGHSRQCCSQQVSPAAWHMNKAWRLWSCIGASGGSAQCVKCAATCGCRWAKQSAWRERQAQQREEQQRLAAASLQQLVASVDHLEERLHHSMQVRGSSAHGHWDLICTEDARSACAQQHAGAWTAGTLRGIMLAFACTAACSCVAVMPRGRADCPCTLKNRLLALHESYHPGRS